MCLGGLERRLERNVLDSEFLEYPALQKVRGAVIPLSEQ